MPLTAPAGLETAVTTPGGYAGALSVIATFPSVGTVDLTPAVVSVGYQTSDTSSYPDDLTDKSGVTNTPGSVTLAGDRPVILSGSPMSALVLLNKDDPACPLRTVKLDGSPIDVKIGANVNGADELVDFPMYLTTVVPAVSSGTVTINFEDVPPGGDNLPAVEAVLIEAPYNSGLTPEFAFDRTARAAWNGTISSWPAQRPNCRLAVGFRSSIWPEVGTLSSSTVVTPVFSKGVFGSAYSVSSGSPASYDLASPITGNAVTAEFWTKLNSAGNVSIVLGGGTAGQVTLTVSTAGGVVVQYNTSSPTFDTWTAVSTLSGGARYIGVCVTQAPGAGTWAATVRVDGTTYTSGTRTFASAAWTSLVNATVSAAWPTRIEALQVSAESSPTWNDTFSPRLVADPSLSVLQAVPAIDAGTNAWNVLQQLAEAEGGWIGMRSGVLTFLNRQTIATQSPSRHVQAQVSLVDLQQSTTGGFQTYDDVLIDYTEYTWANAQVVFSPVKAWKVPARSSQTWTRTLANGLTVGAVDQSITYLSNDAAPPSVDSNGVAHGAGAVQSTMRASLDPSGANEMPDTSKLSGTVQAITPSRIEITVTNHSGHDVWLVSPSNYTQITAGTPSLWVNGVPVTPDQPTIVHPDNAAVPATSQYTVPANPYRQDRDSAVAYANDLLAMLSSPKILYGSVDIVPDMSVTVPDRITLDVPLDGGGWTSLDVLVWGVSFNGGDAAWDMSLDVRAVAGPGQLVWDQGSWDAGLVYD